MGISEKQPSVRPLALRIVQAFFYWLWWLYVYICVTVVTGALIGVVLFITIGALTHPGMDVVRRAEMGLMDGFFYAGMWSGGLAIVLCVMRAYRRNAARRRADAGVPKTAAPLRFEVAGSAPTADGHTKSNEKEFAPKVSGSEHPADAHSDSNRSSR